MVSAANRHLLNILAGVIILLTVGIIIWIILNIQKEAITNEKVRLEK